MVEKSFPFPEGPFLLDIQPLFVIYVTTISWPYWPPLILSSPILLGFFSWTLQSLPIFFLSFYVNASTWPPPAPSLYPHLSSILFPFLAIGSTTSLCHIYLCWSNVAGECASWGDDRKQETAMFIWCFAVCSQGTGFCEGFDTLRVCSKWQDNKGGGRRDSATAVMALSFLDAYRGDLLGSRYTYSCLTCVLKYFQHVNTHTAVGAAVTASQCQLG